MDIQVEKPFELKQKLSGYRSELVLFKPEHSNFLFQCYQNKNFMHLYHSWGNLENLTIEEIKEKLLKEENSILSERKKLEWVVFHKNNDCLSIPIGLIGLVSYNPVNKQAEFSAGFLQEYRKLRIGLEAVLLVLEYAFGTIK